MDIVCQGLLNHSPVHPREVYKSSLLASAVSVIFVHSHPSGDPEPSESDRKITKQLKQAGEMLEINVLGHVIIGRNEYYSFTNKGTMQEKTRGLSATRSESK